MTTATGAAPAKCTRPYRHFQLGELPALTAGRLAGARVELPVKLLFSRGDLTQSTTQLGGLERHAPHAELEVVDGGHFPVGERPRLVANRARAWFA